MASPPPQTGLFGGCGLDAWDPCPAATPPFISTLPSLPATQATCHLHQRVHYGSHVCSLLTSSQGSSACRSVLAKEKEYNTSSTFSRTKKKKKKNRKWEGRIGVPRPRPSCRAARAPPDAQPLTRARQGRAPPFGNRHETEAATEARLRESPDSDRDGVGTAVGDVPVTDPS